MDLTDWAYLASILVCFAVLFANLFVKGGADNGTTYP